MLVLDAKKRPTALQLLEHHWVVEHIPVFTAVPLSVSAIDSIKDFRQKGKLQKLALNMIAHFVEDEKVTELKLMFQTMDTDGNGTITIEEMKAGLESVGLAELTANLDQTMKALDNDGSGKIDYSEFIAATLEKKTALSYDYVSHYVCSNFKLERLFSNLQFCSNCFLTSPKSFSSKFCNILCEISGN